MWCQIMRAACVHPIEGNWFADWFSSVHKAIHSSPLSFCSGLWTKFSLEISKKDGLRWKPHCETAIITLSDQFEKHFSIIDFPQRSEWSNITIYEHISSIYPKNVYFISILILSSVTCLYKRSSWAFPIIVILFCSDW